MFYTSRGRASKAGRATGMITSRKRITNRAGYASKSSLSAEKEPSARPLRAPFASYLTQSCSYGGESDTKIV